jgi:hypothetical protein
MLKERYYCKILFLLLTLLAVDVILFAISGKELVMDALEKSAKFLRSVRFITWIYLILLFIGLSTSIYLFDPLKISMQREVDIDQINESGVKKDVRYHGNIDYILDCFAIESDFVQFGGSGGLFHLQDTNRYYIIPIGNNNFMAYKTSDYFEEQYNELIENSWKELQEGNAGSATGIRNFNGIAVRMNGEEQGLFLKWFNETGFLENKSGNEFDGNLIPYYFVERSFIGIQILFIASVLLSIFMIFCLVTSIRKRSLRNKSIFTLVQNGQEVKVNCMNDIIYSIMSLDDTETKQLEYNINPSISDIEVIKVNASPDTCHYVFEYKLEQSRDNEYKRLETTNIKIIIEQLRRIYEDGKRPVGCK